MFTPQALALGFRSPGIVVLGLLLLSPARMAAAPPRTGEQLYRQLCVRCHGDMGQGTDDEYPHALAGNKSVAQLARLIARTMPKDSKQKCVGEDAEKVATYIHETFYSEAARARNKPPRIELSRLTVREYRNAVADLVGSFRTPTQWGDQRGLRGEYYKSRRFRGGERALERIDPTVRFDFGVESPEPGKLDANEFSIRWSGSVLAPDTGDYTFIVRTEHATRLWINDLDRPLIDAYVKSGNDTEHRASIYLLGGRAYPLRLELSKAKQGVDDSKTNKPKPTKASIALEWDPPCQAAEVVPQRYLSPAVMPAVLVTATPFPPDDRNVGYERGTSVSRAWDRAATEAALDAASYVVARLSELAGGTDSTRVRTFCRKFAERAFRRPLTETQAKLLVDRQLDEAGDLETGVKRAVLLVLKSPRFLYRELGAGEGSARGDAYDTAARLSFGLWDSQPDTTLLEAAAAGKLASRDDVVRQAERMLGDLRTRAKLREFFLQWLKVDQPPDVAKDPKRFPGFDAAVVSDLRSSLDLLLDEVIWSDASDFRQLLLTDTLWLNGRLAKFYGADLRPEAPFQKVSLRPNERAGVLTHPYLMASFAYTAETSPIHRGVFLARSVLGQSLRPPPEALTPLPPDLHPGLTTRERVILQTKPQACQACHSMINPLGFTLENFDAIGRFREKDKGKPIDTTGAYQNRNGDVVKFAGVRDLARFLASSEETHEAFVEQLFHYLVKQPIGAFGPRLDAELRQAFARNDFSVRKLTVEIMAAAALPPK